MRVTRSTPRLLGSCRLLSLQGTPSAADRCERCSPSFARPWASPCPSRRPPPPRTPSGAPCGREPPPLRPCHLRGFSRPPKHRSPPARAADIVPVRPRMMAGVTMGGKMAFERVWGVRRRKHGEDRGEGRGLMAGAMRSIGGGLEAGRGGCWTRCRMLWGRPSTSENR